MGFLLKRFRGRCHFQHCSENRFFAELCRTDTIVLFGPQQGKICQLSDCRTQRRGQRCFKLQQVEGTQFELSTFRVSPRGRALGDFVHRIFSLVCPLPYVSPGQESSVSEKRKPFDPDSKRVGKFAAAQYVNGCLTVSRFA